MVLDPEAHDRAVALTCHAPQVVASLVAARLAAADPSAVVISGQGLRDVTRVAGSDPALWTEILQANARPVADVLDALALDLERVLAALHRIAAAGTPAPAEVVTELLRRGNAGRARVPDKHGGGPAPSTPGFPCCCRTVLANSRDCSPRPVRPGSTSRTSASTTSSGARSPSWS